MDNGWSIGLGWLIARDGVTRWHNGQTGGYHSWAGIYRPRGVAVVVLANTATGWVDLLGERVLQRLLGQELPIDLPPAPVELPPGDLDAYVGTYLLNESFAITITRDGDRLYAQATLQPKLRIYPASRTRFFYRVVDAQITFELDENGRAAGMVLHQNGRDMPAKRTQ